MSSINMSTKHLSRLMTLPQPIRAFNHPRIRLQLSRHRLGRHASNNSHTRPLVLEKPDKFRPPSHPARKPTKPRTYGPRLTEEQKEEQRAKQYPHMMPPEGTFKHYLLTNKTIHLWITFGILFSLAGFVAYAEFHTKNRYNELLPPNSMFLKHPIQFIQQYYTVFQMNNAAAAQEAQLKRARKADEVRKRREYMRAHGVEHEAPFGLGTEEGDEFRRKKEEERKKMSMEDMAREQLAKELSIQRQSEKGMEQELKEGEFRDFEGRKRPVLRKWFGIW